MIRLKTPVPFESGDYDPVEFVCALSAVDHKTHLKAFFNLVNLLRSEDFKEAFRRAETPGKRDNSRDLRMGWTLCDDNC